MLRILSSACLCALLGAAPARAEEPAKPVVVATLFPIVDFARAIAGDLAEIVPLLPPGAEAHSYSPTPADMLRLSHARLFLYVSDTMETWAPGFVADAPASLLVLTVAPESAAHFDAEAEEHAQAAAEDHAHDDECDHDHLGLDPHVWLDPLRAQAMADRIAAALSEADPAHAAAYRANAAALQTRLMELHAEIEKGLADCQRRTLICGGHFAFGHFAERYGLKHHSPYAGFSPNAQPSPRALAELVRTMRELGTTTIFYEEILDPKLARVLAHEIGAKLLPLHSMHNMTPADIASGATYFTLMRRNLENIRQGLGCAP
jgi:zinc transport system substrate-binding protein